MPKLIKKFKGYTLLDFKIWTKSLGKKTFGELKVKRKF